MGGRDLILAGLGALALACGGEEPAPSESTDFECVDYAHDWRRCLPDGSLEYCHSRYTPVPHFHLIRNCDDFGLQCVQLELGKAACALRGQACTAPDRRCVDGVAENCVNGYWVVERCHRGTCQMSDEGAACVR